MYMCILHVHSYTNLLSCAHYILKLAYYYYYVGSGNSEDQEVATDNCDVKDGKKHITAISWRFV